MTRLIELWLLVRENRQWFVDKLQAEGCDCNEQLQYGDVGEPCSYAEQYPEEHNLVAGALHLLDGGHLGEEVQEAAQMLEESGVDPASDRVIHELEVAG
jgi:hypothetical protein